MRIVLTTAAVATLAMAVATSWAHAQQSRLAPPKQPAFRPANPGLIAAQRPTVGIAPSASGGRLITDNGAGLMNRGGNLVSDRGGGFRPR